MNWSLWGRVARDVVVLTLFFGALACFVYGVAYAVGYVTAGAVVAGWDG